MPRFQTSTMIPAGLSSRRYGLIELGNQNADTIREEHVRLIGAVARLLDIAPDQLTYADVDGLAARTLEPVPEPTV